KAIEVKDTQIATLSANECVQIRKLIKTSLSSQISLEQVLLRLETVEELETWSTAWEAYEAFSPPSRTNWRESSPRFRQAYTTSRTLWRTSQPKSARLWIPMEPTCFPATTLPRFSKRQISWQSKR